MFTFEQIILRSFHIGTYLSALTFHRTTEPFERYWNNQRLFWSAKLYPPLHINCTLGSWDAHINNYDRQLGCTLLPKHAKMLTVLHQASEHLRNTSKKPFLFLSSDLPSPKEWALWKNNYSPIYILKTSPKKRKPQNKTPGFPRDVLL